LPLFALTLFISASLMFLVELMFAKMVLPLCGGTPAVWNTCMLFFQAALLLGYAYAHWSTSILKPRTQMLAHLALILPAIALLPIRIPEGWIPPREGNPIAWLLMLMLIAVGLPFLAISTSSPLLQKWFARTRHPGAGDPYFLYVASNAGSLAGLVGYLVVIEPRFTLGEQSRIIEWGYVALVILTWACAFMAWRAITGSRQVLPDAEEPPVEHGAPIPTMRVLRWLGLAFVPSSLMLGVTTYMTTDIAAVPLLWAIPLTLYLLTLMLAFARRPLMPYGVLIRAFPMFVLVQTVVLGKVSMPMPWQPVFHLVTFFTVAMVCHTQLANDRPPVQKLTQFYLVLATGGALGGVFNAMIAPMLFRTVAEYPLVLLLACALCLPYRERRNPENPSGVRSPGLVYRDFLDPVGLGLLTVLAVYGAHASGLQQIPRAFAAVLGVMAVIAFSMSARPIRFALALGAVLLAAGTNFGSQERTLLQARNFFGVVRVTNDSERQLHELIHGSTVHGLQFTSPRMRLQPTAYYCRNGPVGDVFPMVNKSKKAVAVIGLGAGTLAAYAQEGQEYTFYEINPSVAGIALDPRYFTYLADCRKRGVKVHLVLGDGRLTLADAKDGRYDLIVLDAFSGDSIPVHLLTKEALRLYLRKLDEHGLILFHISNQYLDLAPVVIELADEAGASILIADDTESPNISRRLGRYGSKWALVARRQEDFGAITSSRHWQRVKGKAGVRLWTDDYSNILDALVW
jgi:hypothetical protein